MTNLTIDKLGKFSRPREKMVRYGSTRLSVEELLAVVLSSGRRGKNVVSLSREILRVIESEGNVNLSLLQKVKGVGEVKAMKVLAMLEFTRRLQVDSDKQMLCSDDVWREMRPYWLKKKEYFVGFYLNVIGKVLLREVISVGCLDMSLVHPREVFEPAVRVNAAKVVVAHNHPSGSLEPSKEDLEVTKRLKFVGEVLGIELIDHVIVSKEGFFSLEKMEYG